MSETTDDAVADASATGDTGVTDAATAAHAIADQAAIDAAAAQAAEKTVVTVPETYDIAFTDGVTGDAALIEKTAATARELGLSNDQAQALLNFTATHATEQSTQAAADALASFRPGGAEYTKMETGWREAVLADAEIGGTPEKLAQSVEMAKKVLGTFGSQELQTFLHDTGLGSHPAVLKLLCNIGKSTSEGTFITPTIAGGSTRKSDEEVFYAHSLGSKED